jgi:hypothetical protein
MVEYMNMWGKLAKIYVNYYIFFTPYIEKEVGKTS